MNFLINSILEGSVILFNSDSYNIYYIDNLIQTLLKEKKKTYDIVIVDSYEVEFAERYKKTKNQVNIWKPEEYSGSISCENPAIIYFSTPTPETESLIRNTIKRKNPKDIIIIDFKDDEEVFDSLKEYGTVFQTEVHRKSCNLVDEKGNKIVTLPTGVGTWYTKHERKNRKRRNVE